MSSQNMEQQRMRGMLEPLQEKDPDISQIVTYSKFVVAYFLQQEGASPGWRKANIEGPVYLIKRQKAPFYQIIVKNQFSNNDLIDNLHPDWELDCQKNYIFYKIEDTKQQIRGLWFHNDAERVKIETMLEQTMEELRSKPEKPAMMPPPQREAPSANGDSQLGRDDPDTLVSVSRDSVKSVLQELANDDDFVTMIWQKLKSKPSM